jgi:hypothetical protein
MKKHRIYSKRLYIVNLNSGRTSSGRLGTFGRYSPAMITGAKLRKGDYLPAKENMNTVIFRLAVGHLPEHCPRVSFDEARKWLEKNPFGVAHIIHKECVR